uniref:Uncharacterized protein n=1 Tax=Arundo donax TaxID=35708 RepID=A0A0A9BLZ7_ARUDO
MTMARTFTAQLLTLISQFQCHMSILMFKSSSIQNAVRSQYI